jgi:glycosyltransferase involved in cell wall biosynthesis
VVNFVVSSLYQIALRFNKRVFFQNPDDLSVFINKGFVDEGDAVLLNGSGINTETFKRSTKLPSHNSFLFIGRLLRSKGIFEFIRSAELLRKLHPEVLFSIVGPLDDNPESLSSDELQTLIDKGIVRYLGVVLDVKPYLESHQVLVLPSYREGTPRAVLEAMSMSMPIITTHAPGCRETVKEGVNGFLAKPKDTSSLLACMLSIIENPDAIECMGVRSREFVKERYDVHDVNKLIINTIFKL